MAQTTTQANNVAVKFRGRGEREMPPYPKPKSKAQNAAMHAAAAGRSTLGIPKKVGQEFAKGAHGKSLKRLPSHVRRQGRKLARRGLISEKAMKAHFGEDA